MGSFRVTFTLSIPYWFDSLTNTKWNGSPERLGFIIFDVLYQGLVLVLSDRKNGSIEAIFETLTWLYRSLEYDFETLGM